MGKPLIIVGPQASGKTRNSKAFLHAFGGKRVVDNWDGRSPLRDGDLALTNVENFSLPTGFQVISVSEALQRLREAK
ncbi:hypothetical protein [Pseudomonas orientalis]|uniref:Uncharacterized protein n=1 Tax=Pseudomonas orientalis TaxID=76758 RepID=A0A4Q7D2P9_9PSED|nr:hypothetical protein [Pseudomonas orientalis]RZI33115.1 hypothetical protein EUX57_03725 [Pseudomonas orientalis]